MRLHLSFALAASIIFLLTSKIDGKTKPDEEAIKQILTEANTFYGDGDYRKARKAYNKCLELQPDQPDCLCNLASLLLDTGDGQHAGAYYKKALTVTDFKHAGALFNLALMLQESHITADLEDARSLYMRLIEIEPENGDAYANVGAVQHQLGELQKAIKTYMKAIELYAKINVEGKYDTVLSSLHENIGRATLRLAEQITDNEENKKAIEAKAVEFLEVAIGFNMHNEV
jgi:tetratricopeptide (TPR) repeat protein